MKQGSVQPGSWDMATPKRFQNLVQLQQGELQVLQNLTKLPRWFHSLYLRSPSNSLGGMTGGKDVWPQLCTRLSSSGSLTAIWDLDIWVALLPIGHIEDDHEIGWPFLPVSDAKLSEKGPAQKAESQQLLEPGCETPMRHFWIWSRRPGLRALPRCLNLGYQIMKIFWTQESELYSWSLWNVILSVPISDLEAGERMAGFLLLVFSQASKHEF
jgi:hypothetical protein